MSEQNAFPRPPSGDDEGGLRAPPELGPLGKAWWWFHFVILVKLARLRFIAVLVAVGAVIAYWDTLSAYYEKWTRPLLGQETAIGSDIEYWCPMDPGIVRDHPDKCPICHMQLVKRNKGGRDKDEALPPGVVSRVQLSPYKVAVAGIETVEIGPRKLIKEIVTVGFVEFDERKLARITARATGKGRIDKLHVNVTGQMVEKGEPLAELYSPDLVVTVQNLLDARRGGNAALERMARDRLRLWGIDDKQIARIVHKGEPVTRLTIRSPIAGHVITKYQVEGEYVEEGARLYDVADLSTVWIEAQVYEDEIGFLKEGETVTATARAFPNQEFAGKLSFIHPHLDTSTRTLRVRFDMDNPQHALRPGMYATVRLEVPVSNEGQLLSVPERAVIDTGNRQFVYREAESDVFEGVQVKLGPRCGDFYPVLSGLQAGDRVVTTGSFLIDAETRLTAGAASTYFGASGGARSEQHEPARPSMRREEDATIQNSLAKLKPEDRRLVEAQRFCPIQRDTRLGEMGVPIVVEIKGRKVFLCCKVCKKEALEHPEQTLAQVEKLKAKTRSRK
jgi:multidrug efflux pump subunit AcrA (membrane-fusion protein)